ncbi:NAD(P)H-dependent flavin oxidoreductase [Desertibacillus haloalkaliphilus]|uniref:NAD(P)H-dependent flavin oxidoreductase n=1 Tax=Desertibacillus haloalkaliphilus TaxID=1328930 RepID=UPI001C269959|nr:nitronate monooxygenase [Desertibacillus haloalkaliphilus]MBU8907611.1 nitronate monooxygenase [Desertibacillus haloalkaliphilus]
MANNIMLDRLQLKYPIIQAPMAGGITTSELVAAVSNAGGLGMIGAGYMTPDQIRTQIREIKALTTKPFGINVFIPNDFSVTNDQVTKAKQTLTPFYEKVGLQEDTSVLLSAAEYVERFHEQIKVIIDERVPLCSFTFGVPEAQVIEQLKQKNIILVGTATTVQEALINEEVGMDAVVVQGSEAGGHRGTFAGEPPLIGLMSLLPQVADYVKIPVIAAGGIMDSRGINASFCLGATAVQMGTAFLTTNESGAHPLYKEAILKAQDDQAVLTRAFSGKWARGISNVFIEEMKGHEEAIISYPLQNTLTGKMRKEAAAQENPELMSLWSGQSPTLAKKQTVEDLITKTMAKVHPHTRI